MRKPTWLQNADIALYAVLLIHFVFALDRGISSVDLRTWGIWPLEIRGLLGIPIHPLLHGTVAHLLANTIPLFVLMCLSLSFNRGLTWLALCFIVIGGGLLVWVFGEPGASHVGASGVVFGLIGFLLSVGLFRRDWRSITASLIVLVFYGGSLLTLFCFEPGVSWASHVAGFTMGISSSWWTRRMTDDG